jgi:hypothetical protein
VHAHCSAWLAALFDLLWRARRARGGGRRRRAPLQAVQLPPLRNLHMYGYEYQLLLPRAPTQQTPC